MLGCLISPMKVNIAITTIMNTRRVITFGVPAHISKQKEEIFSLNYFVFIRVVPHNRQRSNILYRVIKFIKKVKDCILLLSKISYSTNQYKVKLVIICIYSILQTKLIVKIQLLEIDNMLALFWILKDLFSNYCNHIMLLG